MPESSKGVLKLSERFFPIMYILYVRQAISKFMGSTLEALVDYYYLRLYLFDNTPPLTTQPPTKQTLPPFPLSSEIFSSPISREQNSSSPKEKKKNPPETPQLISLALFCRRRVGTP